MASLSSRRPGKRPLRCQYCGGNCYREDRVCSYCRETVLPYDPYQERETRWFLGEGHAQRLYEYDDVNALEDACVVIERMANGATRPEVSPHLDRLLAHIRRNHSRLTRAGGDG